jgi:phytoene synthase
MDKVDKLKAVLARDADFSDCRQVLREGSHSFFAASLLLPTEYREPITALYAFCRIADDAVDLADDPHQGLQEIRYRLNRIYAGQPVESPVDRAFSEVVREHEIPYTLPAALLEGFSWDVTGRRYPTLSGTYAYSARVAGTVGAMMAILMGVRDTAVLSRACDLGIAMQLTNIARDVGEDARNGRVYLPLDRLRAHGVDVDAWLRKPTFNTGVRRTVFELLRAADVLYDRAEWGICQLPVRVRPAMFAARSIYAEIGREIERRHFDSVSQRAVVSGRRKLHLLGIAVRKALIGRHRDDAPPLRETRFLLDAVTPGL